MIQLVDATILAFTKLQTRKARTVITIVISGLLFGVLITALVVAQGLFNSIRSFGEEGFGNRYIAVANKSVSNTTATQNKQVWKRAQDIYSAAVAEKTAAAKNLGIPYDATTEIAPIKSDDGTVANEYLNIQSPSAQQAIAEYKAPQFAVGIPALQKLVSSYHPSAFYVSDNQQPISGKLQVMNGGKEDLTPQGIAQEGSGQTLSNNPLADGFSETDPALTRPFMLKNVSPTASQSDAIPLIVSYGAAEKLLGFSPLSTSSTAQQKVDRIKELQSRAPQITLSACYRNSVSQAQVALAVETAAAIEKNKNNKDYQKPSLIYTIPSDTTCGPVTVTSDTRTAAQKVIDDKQKQFDRMFGAVVDPDQQKINFRIVGLSPNASTNTPTGSAFDLLQTFVGSTLGGVVAAPSDMYERLPSIGRYKAIFTHSSDALAALSSDTNFVEFSNANDARRFIAEKSCDQASDGTCKTGGTPFQLSAFGSNSIALDDLKAKFNVIFNISMLVIVVIASIVMGGIVGRTITDGRRETAVFRAIGFKRIDIVIIYTAYTLLLSASVALFSILLGVGIAYGIDYYFWHEFTLQAQLAFNASDFTRQFHLFAIEALRIWNVVVLVVLSGFIGSIFPLVRNVRRNPIADMRDE